MKENINNSYKLVLKEGMDYEKMLNNLVKIFYKSDGTFGKVYSIFVDKTYQEGRFYAYVVHIHQFDEERYNTIAFDECVANEILYAIMTSTSNYMIYFKQPSLDIMYEVYYNYTCKLSADIAKKFPEYEYDDIVQTCALVMCNLYKKGYYINKKLIKTSLLNEIYQMHNKKMREPSCIDLNFFVNNEKDESTEFLNNLEDKKLSKKQEDDEHNDVIKSIMDTLTPIIIQKIGERRLKKLIDTYAASCVNANTMVDIRSIRKILNKLGYDIVWFRRQFE